MLVCIWDTLFSRSQASSTVRGSDDTKADDTNADDTNADDTKANETNADDTNAHNTNADASEPMRSVDEQGVSKHAYFLFPENFSDHPLCAVGWA